MDDGLIATIADREAPIDLDGRLRFRRIRIATTQTTSCNSQSSSPISGVMHKKLIRRILHHIAHSGLPLLAKELTEQAARKRTFVIRVVYATMLFLMASLFFYQALSVAANSPLAVLGHGKDMFATVVGLQFAGIYFFMPAMTSGVITQEKSASLQLLFLTAGAVDDPVREGWGDWS